MIVSKFGGTSVGSAKNISQVIEIIAKKKDKNIVVVSAVGGITNLLVASAKLAHENKNYVHLLQEIETIHFQIIEELLPQNKQSKIKGKVKEQISLLETTLNGVFLLKDLSTKSQAKISSFGEALSSIIIYEALLHKGLSTVYFNSIEHIKTDSNYTNSHVNHQLTYQNIQQFVKEQKAKIVLAPGFIASNEANEITTLGRGGSDFTAAIFANALDAELLEIWTDVSGLYTANPKLVKQAKPIDTISYQEAMELSYFGAKVIYPPTIQPVLDKSIPILVKNTFKPNENGTLISNAASKNNLTVTGISHIENIALLTLEGNGMVGVPGISKRFFEALLLENINVKFITQASSEQSICIAIDAQDASCAKKAIDNQFALEILQHKVHPVVIEKDLAIIALVGDNMKSHQGISGKMFSSLGYNNVNIKAIAQGSTEKNISAIIDKKDVKKALNTLHASFFENQIKQINLFIMGVGNVGGKLLEQIEQQQKFLLNKLHINLRVIGLSNSKKMYFEENGIDLSNWSEKLVDSELTTSFSNFFQKVKTLNLRNSVFVDNTANSDLPHYYEDYLKQSIAVVACNKVACSSSYENYVKLKKLSREYSAPFLYETNVGAGLPIIDTLQNLINSGDEITKIQAVLSGSLNFIFNNFNDKNTFSEVVHQAGIEGYTEPDPRIDLSGVDVMRKILILIRESGKELELQDIDNVSFLPESSMQADTVEKFKETLIAETDHFAALYTNAAKNNCRLKYVAEYDNGIAKAGLKEIPKDHAFYNLDGKDNIVLFYTKRYQDQPLIIKGAGAGAEVTASGIFGDIIRTVNK